MTLTQILCWRLRRTSEQVEDVLSGSLEARLAKALLQLMEDAKSAESRDPEVVRHLSQNDLAMIAGKAVMNSGSHAFAAAIDDTPASRSSLTMRSCNVPNARSMRPFACELLAQMMSMFSANSARPN
jgi:hypothetical protein